MGKDDAIRIEYIPLASAVLWDRNPKQHDIGKLIQSIERYGFIDPPKYDAALDAIVYGNGRTIALAEMKRSGRPAPRGVVARGDGEWLIPVKFGVDQPTKAQAEALGVDHNNLTMSGGDYTGLDMARMWEQDTYAALLAELAKDGQVPLSVDEDIDALLKALNGGSGEQAEDPGAQESIADELQRKWKTEVGQVWACGESLIICGDSTDRTVIERLMGDDRAEMVWTDPPYGVAVGDKNKFLNSIARSNRVEENLENDTLDEPGLVAMLCAAFDNAIAFCTAGAAWHVAAPAVPLHVLFGQVLKDRGIWRQTIQWVKNNATLAPLGVCYHWRAEPIFFGWLPNGAHRYYGDRKQDTVWNIDRPVKSPEHPTMKPVELVERAIENHSRQGEIVLDMFSGSGTTLIACERLGRKCRAVEISPAYVAVALERWATMTGLTPRLVEG